MLAEYLLFHFGTVEEILPKAAIRPAGMVDALDFAVRTPAHFAAHRVARGLDLGCAVGRSAFEMSRTCDEVIGIDFSHAFIEAAEALRGGRRLDYPRLEEAGITSRLEARIPRGAVPERVSFQQGDAMALPADLGVFDRVHAANLLCRLSRPQILLERLPGLVKSGGELVLATPCTWLDAYTPPENWPQAGTFEWLKSCLSGDFELVRQTDEAFLIRETARKFQWTSSLVTVWRRRTS
jgi:putative 4-mercaptohistidine N1-methyltranferase